MVARLFDNIELSSSIITFHIAANEWRNTVGRCNYRGATVSIGLTLVEGATLEIGEWCNRRRCNSVDWCNTHGRRNTGNW